MSCFCVAQMRNIIEQIISLYLNDNLIVAMESGDNVSGVCSGWKQVELNDLGKEQAVNLGNVNKDLKLDMIFTSDLIRATESADLAFPNQSKIIDERLRECNYGVEHQKIK